jgi:hypothetical protein
MEYFEESDSMFKRPEVSQRKFENSHIANLTLIERRSYYRCEPAEEKYGIGLEGKEWWVFHGCGGIFEVTECSSNGQPLKMRPESDLAMTQQKADKKEKPRIITCIISFHITLRTNCTTKDKNNKNKNTKNKQTNKRHPPKYNLFRF